MHDIDKLICKSPEISCHPYIEHRQTQYGTGIFTTHHIPANTIIINEKSFFLPKKSSITDTTEYICLSIQQLLIHKKEEFLSLTPFDLDEYALEELKNPSIAHWHKKLLPELSTEQMHLCYMKYWRNTFLVDGKNEMDSLAILIWGTRLNHSCEPSVEFKPNGDRIIFKTIRSIMPNTELFINYLDSKIVSKLERQKELLRTYGFLCQCEKCEKEL